LTWHCNVGIGVGDDVGIGVGVDVGGSVGADVGIGVGGAVGTGVGADVGGSVGASEGRNVGDGVLALFDFPTVPSSKHEIQRIDEVEGNNKLYAGNEYIR
jgi:hypothetical protein